MYKRNDLGRRKFLILCFLSCFLGILSYYVAQLLLLSINLFTQLFWVQKFSFERLELSQLEISPISIFIPALGGLIVGLMAKFGSAAIRGHGIPEVMENILTKQSRIPRRMTLLKPLSAAISIGSGGPFGAEGPIIATGSSIGSWLGRHFYFSEYDRKVLLAVGASSGMTAIFGTPLAAVFICIELLLFEFSAKSFIPILMGVSSAYAIRLMNGHITAEFPISSVHEVISGGNLLFYFLAGAVTGGVACIVSKLVFLIEDLFEKLPIHWMWWPLLGGVVVGIIGFIDSRTLGVGYSNITHALQGKLLLVPALTLFILKFLSWSIALGSGTSGGTLAPLLTFGSSLGVVLGSLGVLYFPDLGISVEVTALVCMSAMFSGATRAVLTSTLFALEATGAHFGIAPLLLGNSAAFLCSLFFLRQTIMTEKIVRRGIHVPDEYFSVKS
jgi:CIC family chloride channel protein